MPDGARKSCRSPTNRFCWRTSGGSWALPKQWQNVPAQENLPKSCYKYRDLHVTEILETHQDYNAVSSALGSPVQAYCNHANRSTSTRIAFRLLCHLDRLVEQTFTTIARYVGYCRPPASTSNGWNTETDWSKEQQICIICIQKER
jgi:hypothetical protein